MFRTSTPYGLGLARTLFALGLTILHGNANARQTDAPETMGSEEAEIPPSSFRTDAPTPVESESEKRESKLPEDVPLVAYTTNAFAGTPATIGASGFTETRATPSGTRGLANAGLRIFASPFDRLSLMIDAQRREENDEFAPSLTAQIRILDGGFGSAWALGVLGRYKTEGFAELGGELEGGVLFSVGSHGLHLDSNLIAGGDFDGGESDGEFLARFGYDASRYLRVGLEGRGRYRISGVNKLPGNRDWDAFGGPQLMVFADHYFAAVTAGPSTVGISDNLGIAIICNVGGVAFR